MFKPSSLRPPEFPLDGGVVFLPDGVGGSLQGGPDSANRIAGWGSVPLDRKHHCYIVLISDGVEWSFDSVCQNRWIYVGPG